MIKFTSEIAAKYDVDFKDMLFGGTEKQIIERGTDWCADMVRVCAVLLQCSNIPCRIVHLANLEKAYNGHVVCEAYYEGRYGVIDPIYGYMFYDNAPISAYDIMKEKSYLHQYKENYSGLYSAIAISEYDPTSDKNDYTTSVPNAYTLKLNNSRNRNLEMDSVVVTNLLKSNEHNFAKDAVEEENRWKKY